MTAIKWVLAALVFVAMTAVIAVAWPPTFPPSYLSQQGGQIVYLPTPTPTSTPPPPQLIQQNSAAAATGTSAQVSMVSPCTSGNLVVLTWGSAALSTNAIASSVSNLGNAAWTKVTSGLNSGNGTAEIWTATCGSTPGTTSTITFPASTNPSWNISEWHGFTATQDAGSPTFSNSSYNAPNITTTTANDLLIAMSSTSAGFPVVSSPYSTLNTANVFQQGEFQIVSATGTYSTNYTMGAGNTQVSAFAAFTAPAMTVPLSIVGTPTTATSTTSTCTVSPPAPTVATDALFGYVFSGSNTITDNAGMTDLGTSAATGTGWYVDLRGILLSGAPPTSVIFTAAANTINFCELISFAGISNSITKDPAASNPSSAAVSNLVPSSGTNGLTSTSNGDLMFFGAGQTINTGTYGTFGAPTPTLTGGSWANGIQSNTAGQATEMWWSAQTTAGQTGTISSTMGCTNCTNPRSTGALWSVLANGTGSPPPTLVSIAVTPNPATITGVQGTQQFVATGTYSSGPPAIVTNSCNPWASSNTSIATISTGGLATSQAVGGPINITCTIGSIVGTASLTVTSSSGQTANANCVQTAGTSGSPAQWAGSGCTVAFTVPSRPAISSPLIFQDGVQRTYGSTTCTPHADSTVASPGTDNTPCMRAAIAAGNVEIYPPASGNAGKAYLLIGDIGVPNNRTIICCTDPAGNCSSTTNNYNPQGGTVAIQDNTTLSADSDVFDFWNDPNRGGGCPSGQTCGANDTLYGCQFRGLWYNIKPPPGVGGAKVMVHLSGLASTNDIIEVNDFYGEPGQVGPISLSDDTGTGNGPQNTLIQWNTIRSCANNDVEVIAAHGLQILHNSSTDCNGYFENNALVGVCPNGASSNYTDIMTNNLVEWNTETTTVGSGYCQQLSPSNPSPCNDMTAGQSCCHGGCTGSQSFDYSGNKMISNAVIGSSGTNLGAQLEEGGTHFTPGIYFDNLCTSGNHCTIWTPPGSSYSDGSCTLPSQGCSNQ